MNGLKSITDRLKDKRLLLALAVVLGSTPAHSQWLGSGLDPSFGTGGKVVTQFGGAGDLAQSIAVQPDGKLLAAGTTNRNGSTDIALARYNSDGTLDGSFGMGGKVTTDVGGSYDGAASIAVQWDGKIVVGGWAVVNSFANFAVVRYNSDGTLDATFGTGGKVITSFEGVSAQGYGVVVQPDGKIVQAGYANVDGGYDFALVRYNSNGTLDFSFGMGGKAITDFGTAEQGFSVAQAFSLALQDGKIVAAGQAFMGAGFDFALARYNSNGTLDASFGNGGKVTTNFLSNDRGSSVAVQPDGRIVVAGMAVSPISRTPDFALARYNNDGTLDSSFGTAGKVTTDFAGSSDGAFAIAQRGDGKLVAVGQSFQGFSYDFAAARYNGDGTLDATFGNGGKVTTNFFNLADQAFAVAVQPDGKAVAAGSANYNGITGFAIARYQ